MHDQATTTLADTLAELRADGVTRVRVQYEGSNDESDAYGPTTLRAGEHWTPLTWGWDDPRRELLMEAFNGAVPGGMDYGGVGTGTMDTATGRITTTFESRRNEDRYSDESLYGGGRDYSDEPDWDPDW